MTRPTSAAEVSGLSTIDAILLTTCGSVGRVVIRSIFARRISGPVIIDRPRRRNDSECAFGRWPGSVASAGRVARGRTDAPAPAPSASPPPPTIVLRRDLPPPPRSARYPDLSIVRSSAPSTTPPAPAGSVRSRGPPAWLLSSLLPPDQSTTDASPVNTHSGRTRPAHDPPSPDSSRSTPTQWRNH